MRPDLKKISLFTHWQSGKAGPERTSSKLRPLARLALPLVAAFTVIGMVAAPASANRRQDAMSFAMKQVGCPYVWGGTGPCSDGFDCAGLVQAAWAAAGVDIPRDTYEQ